MKEVKKKQSKEGASLEPPQGKSKKSMAIEDPRFASMARDPRFSTQSKKKATVAIDKRFKGMFDDPDFQVTTGVDKRGRKVEAKKGEDLKRYYHQEEEEADEEGEDEDEDEDEARKRFLRARGMLDESSSEEEASDDHDQAEAEAEAEEADQEEWGVGAMAANPDEEIPMVDATHRIAIVDLDWDHVKAVDILAVLRSFAPKGGLVSKVTVYPSDYGLERMAEEATLGPKKVFKSSKEPPLAAAAVAEGGKQGLDRSKGGKKARDEEDEEEGRDEEVDKKRLAMYEKSKLRWYYAVAECDKLSTSSRVYRECDGLEFERSACKFDLRFIPDDMSFDGRQVRDSASSVPSGYDPPDAFNLSLQHTDPKLSWDADDDSRKKVLQKKMSEDEIKEGDFEAYLGSEEDDDDDQEDEQERAAIDPKDKADKIRERYRLLLLGGAGKAKDDSRGKSWGADDEGEEGEDDEDDNDDEEGNGEPSARIKGRDGMDMEVTFVSGLESLGDKLLSKKREEEMKKGETVWDAYLRKKKEKKKERKQGRSKVTDESSDSDYDDVGDEGDKGVKKGSAGDEEDPFDDPFFKDGGADGVPVDSEDEEMDDDDEDKDKDEEEGGHGSRKKLKLSNDKGKKVVGAAGKTGTKGKSLSLAERQEEKKRKAELELLLMDDAALKEAAVRGMPGAVKDASRASKGDDEEEEDKPGSGKKRMSRKERLRLKKEQRKDARQGSDDEDVAGGSSKGRSEEGGGFKADLEDPRFKQLFQSHEFALDPTDPRFASSKKGGGSESLMKEVSRKKGKGRGGQVLEASDLPPVERVRDKVEVAPVRDASVDKWELKKMVNKMKRKGDERA